MQSVTARLRYRPSRVQQHSAGGVRAFNAGSCVGSRSDRTSLELDRFDRFALDSRQSQVTTIMHAPSSLQPAGRHARPSIRPADHIAPRHSSIGADRCIAYCMHTAIKTRSERTTQDQQCMDSPSQCMHGVRTKPLPDPDPMQRMPLPYGTCFCLHAY